MPHLLAALTWDPQVRGFSIVLLSVLILCGSVYLLLATNTGARLGLLLAFAGLTGWMFLMGILWWVFGIGLVGDPPTWHVEELVAGPPGASALEELDGFEERVESGEVEVLQAGDAILADAQAAADRVLSSAAGEAGADTHGGGGAAAEPPKFDPPFEDPNDYVYVAGYRMGGEDSFLPGGLLEHDRGFFHAPHYAVVVAQPAITEVSLDGAPVPPRPDPSAEPYTVVMVRDLGNLRWPPFVLTVSMGILFGLSVYALHKRDREALELQPAPATA